MRDLRALQSLWELVDELINQAPQLEDKKSAMNSLKPYALVLTDTMMLERLSHVYRGTAEPRALFPEVTWVHDLVPERTYPGRYVTDFGVRQAVDLLAEMPIDQLENLWRIGRLDLPRLFRWFEAGQIEIFADDPSLQREIRQLPLCSVAGELRPLAHLYIPGGFEDPLKLAGIVDLDAIGGRRQFLRDLGVEELDFATYVQEEIPRVLAQNPELPSDARHHLLGLLAERLGEFRDDGELRDQLIQLPLIPCLDGSFRAAEEVYSSRAAMALLGDRVHIAEPVDSQAMKALYNWLQVRDQPSGADIVGVLLTISQEWGSDGTPLNAATKDMVRRCWLKLNDLFDQGAITSETLAPLSGQKVVPDSRQVLTQPNHLFFADRVDLAALFTAVADHILPSDLDWGRVLHVVGVRPLSQAAQLQLVEPVTTTADPNIQEHITSRRDLILRVLKADPTVELAALSTSILDNLRVMKAANLQIRYWLPIGGEVVTTEPETVAIKLVVDARVLYVTYEGELYPWTAVARELAMAIKKTQPIGGLAVGIKEVLAADTIDHASQTLDELGYP